MVSTNSNNVECWTRKERNTLTEANNCICLAMDFWVWVTREVSILKKEKYSEMGAKDHFMVHIVKCAFEKVNLDDIENANINDIDIITEGLDLNRDSNENWTRAILRIMHAVVRNSVTAIKAKQDSQTAWTYVSDARYWTGVLQVEFSRLICKDNDLNEDVIAEVRTIIARENANVWVKKDPRQDDKLFVFDCWKNWQQKPSSYVFKSDFAKDMLEKCEHLKSQKKIEDWCRDWEKSSSG